MNSATLPSFWDMYRKLDRSLKAKARKAYRLWSEDPFHPSLRFKCINREENVWAVRLSLGPRVAEIPVRGRTRSGRMGRGPSDLTEPHMKCTVCGARISPGVTDLPFKLSEERIVILKQLPVLQCQACREYLIENTVMARINLMLEGTNSTAELEVLRYAA